MEGKRRKIIPPFPPLEKVEPNLLLYFFEKYIFGFTFFLKVNLNKIERI
jgi:hypothetical protein